MKRLGILLRVAGLAVLLITGSTLPGCGGGGGGGGDFVGAAFTTIEATPDNIDTGDRTMVTVRISDVHTNGIVLKLRYPSGLRYVTASSLLTINDSEGDATPRINDGSGNTTYLVFFFSQAAFGDNEGVLTLELEGVSSISDGEIEVDADVDDPKIDNANEFSIDAPEFAAEDSATIDVVG